jgi:hypothetical protein
VVVVVEVVVVVVEVVVVVVGTVVVVVVVVVEVVVVVVVVVVVGTVVEVVVVVVGTVVGTVVDVVVAVGTEDDVVVVELVVDVRRLVAAGRTVVDVVVVVGRTVVDVVVDGTVVVNATAPDCTIRARLNERTSPSASIAFTCVVWRPAGRPAGKANCSLNEPSSATCTSPRRRGVEKIHATARLYGRSPLPTTEIRCSGSTTSAPSVFTSVRRPDSSTTDTANLNVESSETVTTLLLMTPI